MSRRWILLPLLPLMLLGVPSPAQNHPPLTLPDEAYPQMVQHSAKLLQDVLADPTAKKANERALNIALLLAAYAEQNLTGPDARQRTAVRDVALTIDQLVRAGQVDKALEAARTLPNPPINANAPVAKAKNLNNQPVEELMRQFTLPRRGGEGIEARLMKLAEGKGPLNAKDLNDDLLRTAYQTAVAAELLQGYPQRPAAAKVAWDALAEDVRVTALELAAAVKKKDGGDARIALKRLDASCQNCHEIVRRNALGVGPRPPLPPKPAAN